MKKLLLLLPIIAMLATSCNKEQERTYSFWWDLQSSYNMEADGITELYLYVDGDFIGRESVFTYWNSDPGCFSDAPKKVFTYTKREDWTGKSIYFKVEDQYGLPIFFDAVFNEADCLSTELVY